MADQRTHTSNESGSAKRPRSAAIRAPKPATANDQNDQHRSERSERARKAERLRRRAAFLQDLAEARELRARVAPRRFRVARIHEALRQLTYRS